MTLNTKNAFTLAEILITLAIIGIVASLTIPALINQIEIDQSKTGNRIAFNFMSDVISQIKNDNGGNIEGIGGNITALLRSKLSIPLNTSWDWHNSNTWYSLNGVPVTSGTGWPVLKLNNGMFLHINLSSTCNIVMYGTPRGKPTCGHMYVDINGFKKPNTLGKDIFMYWIIDDGVVPGGTIGDIYTNTCITSSNGRGCAAKYLRE